MEKSGKKYFESVVIPDDWERSWNSQNELLEALLSRSKLLLELVLPVLQEARSSLKAKGIDQVDADIQPLLEFKRICKSFLAMSDELKNNLIEIKSTHDFLRLNTVMYEIVSKSTTRKSTSKIPKPDKNLIDSDYLIDNEIDYIIRKMRDYWAKFAQVYATTKFALILKSRKA